MGGALSLVLTLVGVGVGVGVGVVGGSSISSVEQIAVLTENVERDNDPEGIDEHTNEGQGASGNELALSRVSTGTEGIVGQDSHEHNGGEDARGVEKSTRAEKNTKGEDGEDDKDLSGGGGAVDVGVDGSTDDVKDSDNNENNDIDDASPREATEGSSEERKSGSNEDNDGTSVGGSDVVRTLGVGDRTEAFADLQKNGEGNPVDSSSEGEHGGHVKEVTDEVKSSGNKEPGRVVSQRVIVSIVDGPNGNGSSL